jgi:hypothetical protein
VSTTPSTIRIGYETAPSAILRALASLPTSFRLVDSEAPSILVVDGAAEWMRAIEDAANAGVHGALLVNPTVRAAAQLESLSTRLPSRFSTVIDSQWTTHAAVSDFNHAAAQENRQADFIDATATSGVASTRATSDVALDLLRLVRQAVAPLTRLYTYSDNGHGFSATGEANNTALVHLSFVRSGHDRGQARINAFTADSQWSLTVPHSEASAAPAEAFFVDAAGEHHRPTLFEDTHRTALRALRDSVQGDGPFRNDLAEFARDATLLDGAQTH